MLVDFEFLQCRGCFSCSKMDSIDLSGARSRKANRQSCAVNCRRATTESIKIDGSGLHSTYRGYIAGKHDFRAHRKHRVNLMAVSVYWELTRHICTYGKNVNCTGRLVIRRTADEETAYCIRHLRVDFHYRIVAEEGQPTSLKRL
jgi:hypothetical protein